MSLDEIKNMLLEVTPNVHHYKAWKESESYIVWAEDGESSSTHADNKKLLQVLDVTIDLFTRMENDPLIGQLQQAFNDREIPFELLSVQFEDDTSYIHYEYLIQAVI